MYSSGSNGPQCSSGSSAYYKSPASTPYENPPDELWYHGDISKNEAETSLKGGHPGLFLVRRSGPKCYYLSHVDSSGVVVHLPIRQLNASFYFMGQPFGGLADVVDHFASVYSDVISDDVSPICCSTTSQANFGEKFLCKRNVRGVEMDELSASVGDVISVMQRTDDSNWVWARNEATGMVGIAPAHLLQPVLSTCEEMNELPYFYDTISTNIVRPLPLGSFLLRRSTKGVDAYALLVKTQTDLVEKFLIVGTPAKGFLLAGRPFGSIGHVIDRYTTRAISGNLRLSHAIFRSSFDDDDDEDDDNYIEVDVELADDLADKIDDDDDEDARNSKRLRQQLNLDLNMDPSTTTSTAASLPSPSTTVSTAPTSTPADDALFAMNVDSETASTVVAATQALRKSREEKQWKECWLTLSDLASGGSRLVITQSQNGSKRRMEFDLRQSWLFWLDDSVFGADGCVFLSHTQSHQQAPTFLSFRPIATFARWLGFLRARVASVQPQDHVSLLFVDVDKYRADGLKSDSVYSTSVLVNGVKMCTSNSFGLTGKSPADIAPTVVFDSRFVLPCIPTGAASLQLAVVAHSNNGKKGRPFGLSKLIQLPETASMTTSSDDGFSFRLQRRRVPIFLSDLYFPLLDAIKNTPEELLRTPSSVLPQQHRSFLYTCLVLLYLTNSPFLLNMFRRVTEEGLASTTGEDLFRKDSMTTGLVGQCLRHLLKPKLDEFIQSPTIAAAVSKSSPCPSVGETVAEFIETAVTSSPAALAMLAVVAQGAKKRFNQVHLVRRALSTLLVLRFLNPVLLGLGKEGSSQVAKAVQGAANLAAAKSVEETLTPATAVFRRLFDRIADHSAEESEECSVDQTNVELLATVAHMVAVANSSRPSDQQLDERPKLTHSLVAFVNQHL